MPPEPPTLDCSSYRAIAVLPFQTEAFLARYGAEIADQIIIEILARDPGFPVVERTEIDRILKENGGGPESLGACPGLIPADLILTGSVAYGIGDFNNPGPVRQALLTATVRAFETDSGRIVWAGRFSTFGEDLLRYQAGDTYYRFRERCRDQGSGDREARGTDRHRIAGPSPEASRLGKNGYLWMDQLAGSGSF